LPETDPRLASLAASLRPWLPASGYQMATLARELGFEIEGMPAAETS
jgi:hypothetical protein